MKKNCSFKLEKILGLDTNVFRCATCDEKVYTKSIWAPVRQCPAVWSPLQIPDEMQQYISAALRWPKPHRIEGDLYFFRLQPGNRMLQVPLAALDAGYLEYIRENLYEERLK